ncbi:MAG: thiamine phosphate synthase [Candidatus Margulisbacteria bacterium]|nr:thiamine phosphate synthase [Candidatus Margulisiibacteriota bacterium]
MSNVKCQIFRILDANANRAMEGLRITEELSRFVLDDHKLTYEIKKLRGELAKAIKQLPKDKLLSARQSLKDVGRKTYSKTEAKRSNLMDIFNSNIKRSQEALRSLEEFSKLINPSLGKKFKDIRFRSYEVEKQLSKLLKLDFYLYMVSDPKYKPIESIKKAIKAGVKIVQLRDKGTSKADYLRQAKKVREIAKRAGVVFIVNDYIDIAKRVDADGIHLGQDDPPPQVARKTLGDYKIIGISTHNLSQALKAQKDGADYISVGPIFKTPSKPGVKPLGVMALKRIRKKISIPIVAIGGIDPSNIAQIHKTGVSRTAGIRAFFKV